MGADSLLWIEPLASRGHVSEDHIREEARCTHSVSGKSAGEMCANQADHGRVSADRPMNRENGVG